MNWGVTYFIIWYKKTIPRVSAKFAIQRYATLLVSYVKWKKSHQDPVHGIYTKWMLKLLYRDLPLTKVADQYGEVQRQQRIVGDVVQSTVQLSTYP